MRSFTCSPSSDNPSDCLIRANPSAPSPAISYENLLIPVSSLAMPANKVPQPGPAKLTRNSGPDEWLKCALNNQYLPEAIMKKLCEICKELLMEGECRYARPSLFWCLQEVLMYLPSPSIVSTLGGKIPRFGS